MSSASEATTVAVIGAGVAGLACARALLVADPTLRVTVLDGADRVGGKLRLGEVAGTQVDLGAESILARRPEGVGLATAVGLGDEVVHPQTIEAGLWTRGEVRALPATWMGLPVDPEQARRTGVLSRRAATRATLERWMPGPDLTDDTSIGHLVARRFGPEVRDRLVEPLLGGVYAGHSDELSVHAAMPPLVAAVEAQGSLTAAARALRPAPDGAGADAPPPVFAGIRGGVGRLPGAIAADVSSRGGEIRLDAMVRQLHRRPEGWEVVTGPTVDPTRTTYDAVVLATPATPTARLLRDACPAAARELGRIEYASMALVTLAFERTRVGQPMRGSGFLVPPVDGRTIKAATFVSAKWDWAAGDVVIVRCSIGRHREETDLQRDDRELVEVAALDLRDAVGLHAPLLDATVTRWGGALPQYAVGHRDRVDRIRAAVADVPGLQVCGAAYDGIGIPAVVADAEAAATRLLDGLGGPATMAP